MYDALPLPWDVASEVPQFPKLSFVRHEYDRDGILTNGKSFFFAPEGGQRETLEEIEEGLGTASMVTRWREKNKELVWPEKDCVRVLMGDLREALGARKWIERGSGTVVLLFKRV